MHSRARSLAAIVPVALLGCMFLAGAFDGRAGASAAETSAATPPTSSKLVLAGTSLGGKWVLSRAFSVSPSIQKIEMEASGRQEVKRPYLPKSSIRSIHLTGPWLDHTTSVTGAGGVTGSVVSKGGGQVRIRLTASSSATVGVKTLRVNVTCPLWAPVVCKSGSAPLYVLVNSTGPIRAISPNGQVEPNRTMDFSLTGADMHRAKLPANSSARVLSRTATTLRIRTTTPVCGEVRFLLYDENTEYLGFPEDHYSLQSGYVHAHVGVACDRGRSVIPTHGGQVTCPPYCE